MLYSAYEMHRSFMNAASNWAAVSAQFLSNPALPFGYFGLGPAMASALKVFAHFYEERGKPDFGIRQVKVGSKSFAVSETVVLQKPFGSLRHFKRAGLPADAPRLLLVAPMSGHYATLLRGTVARLVENQEVWVTDWADAKLVPLSEGYFDLDDYIDYLIEYLQFIGDGGYDRRELWDDAGWQWRESEKVSHPAFWVPESDGARPGSALAKGSPGARCRGSSDHAGASRCAR